MQRPRFSWLAWPNLIMKAIATCALTHGLLLAATGLPLAAAVGDETVSLQGAKISSDDVFQFFFEATAGKTYPVAVSTDLLNWSLLTNAVGPGGPVSIEDEDASQFPRRFYQIGLPANPQPTPITNMVFISPGTFTMGSPESEADRDSNEGPPTIVRLSRGFWIGKYEVTQSEYISVMSSNISFFAYDSRLPVDFATWFHATNYCYNLTLRERAAGRLPEGYYYRLPTEAEWEYACRAGTTTPVGLGDGNSLSAAQANFDGAFPYGDAAPGRFLNRTSLPGSYPPNAWGLHDMHGNLWEWCQDWYGPYKGGRVTDPKGPPAGSARVLRGGGYTSVGKSCRSARRDSRSPTYKNIIQGFRVVLAADSPTP